MKIKVTFPGDHVEFDVKDVPELMRLCESAKCFKESGYGSSKFRTYTEDPITLELAVPKQEAPAPEEPPFPPPASEDF